MRPLKSQRLNLSLADLAINRDRGVRFAVSRALSNLLAAPLFPVCIRPVHRFEVYDRVLCDCFASPASMAEILLNSHGSCGSVESFELHPMRIGLDRYGSADLNGLTREDRDIVVVVLGRKNLVSITDRT